MSKEETRTDLGTIKIHKNVIAAIAAIAACEIEGVNKIGVDLKSGFLELMGKKSPTAIKVEFNSSDEVDLIIPLVIKNIVIISLMLPAEYRRMFEQTLKR